MATDTSDHHHDHDHHDHGHHCVAEPSALFVELREHIPFSVAAVAIGLVVAGTICILGFKVWDPSATICSHDHGVVAEVGELDLAVDLLDEHDHDLGVGHVHDHGSGTVAESGCGHDHHSPAMLFFHLFHPVHMLFSAAATSAMFFRYEKRLIKAIIIGLIGAIGVCGVSDIVMPQISLWILGAHTHWHVCVIEHPGVVMPFAIIGVLVGIAASGSARRSTLVSHSLHVTASTMASIFYMVGALGMVAWIDTVGRLFLFVVLAVMVPCCLSDIVFPMLMSKPGRMRYEQEPHAH